jgi:hypothetical protein
VPVISSRNIFPQPAAFELRDLAALVLGGGRAKDDRAAKPATGGK